MKRLLRGVILILLYSCHFNHQEQIPVNQLEKRFENVMARKEYVSRVILFEDQSRESREYYVGYDSKERIVDDGNSEFYEYDSQGRPSKKYMCVLDRDPECKDPFIFTYEYAGKNLKTIKQESAFGNDNAIHILETFEYDQLDRLVKHTKNGKDTTIYFYTDNDTMKSKLVWTSWLNNAENKWVRTCRETTFTYDNLGRVASSTWVEGDISMRNDYTYDKQARLVLKRDTLLSDFNHEPNSCCIIYWTEMKYDDRSRLIEEIHSSGSFEDPNPKFRWTKKFEYKESAGEIEKSEL